MRSGTYGIERNFGNNHGDYNERDFLNYVNEIGENKIEKGGLYMPLLVKKQHLELIGYYPEGNIRMDSQDIFKPIIAKRGEQLIPGDQVLMEKLRRINVHHIMNNISSKPFYPNNPGGHETVILDIL